MDNLLLLYIVTLLVAAYFGMSIVLKVMQSLPTMGFGAMPSGSVRSDRDQHSGSGGIFVFLFIVAFLFWMFFKHSQTGQDKQPSVNYESPDDNSQRVDLKSETLMISFPDTEGSRVNVPPSKAGNDLVDFHFAIQVDAFTDLQNARDRAFNFDAFQTEIIEEAGLFKVIISGFESRTSANDFLRHHRLKGFVRTVSTLS